MKKDKSISIRIPSELHLALLENSRCEMLTLSAHIENVLLQSTKLKSSSLSKKKIDLQLLIYAQLLDLRNKFQLIDDAIARADYEGEPISGAELYIVYIQNSISELKKMIDKLKTVYDSDSSEVNEFYQLG